MNLLKNEPNESRGFIDEKKLTDLNFKSDQSVGKDCSIENFLSNDSEHNVR